MPAARTDATNRHDAQQIGWISARRPMTACLPLARGLSQGGAAAEARTETGERTCSRKPSRQRCSQIHKRRLQASLPTVCAFQGQSGAPNKRSPIVANEPMCRWKDWMDWQVWQALRQQPPEPLLTYGQGLFHANNCEVTFVGFGSSRGHLLKLVSFKPRAGVLRRSGHHFPPEGPGFYLCS